MSDTDDTSRIGGVEPETGIDFVPVLPSEASADNPGLTERTIWLYRRLQGFADRLARGAARPGELTAIFDVGGYSQHSHRCFCHMARQVVRRKYLDAGRPGVVRCLDAVSRAENSPHIAITAPWRLYSPYVYQSVTRIWVHARRWRCDDPDLFACMRGMQDPTSWVFQCPDLRFRIHDQTWPRLRFMIECWSHYARHGIDRPSIETGQESFPLTTCLRPEIDDPLPDWDAWVETWPPLWRQRAETGVGPESGQG